jgi:hypothetical protein
MTELSQSGAANSQQSAADEVRLMLGEILFAADQMIDRTRTETHLFSEFVSKMAGSHSVKNLRRFTWSTVASDRHHAPRLRTAVRARRTEIETTSNLFANRLHN